jgi:hypothetical protein
MLAAAITTALLAATGCQWPAPGTGSSTRPASAPRAEPSPALATVVRAIDDSTVEVTLEPDGAPAQVRVLRGLGGCDPRRLPPLPETGDVVTLIVDPDGPLQYVGTAPPARCSAR